MILIHSLNFISLNSIISHQIHLIFLEKVEKSSKYPPPEKMKKVDSGGVFSGKGTDERF